jgi:hypothetical protein
MESVTQIAEAWETEIPSIERIISWWQVYILKWVMQMTILTGTSPRRTQIERDSRTTIERDSRATIERDPC